MATKTKILICRVSGCGKQLGSSNTSGYCHEHRIMGCAPKPVKVA